MPMAVVISTIHLPKMRFQVLVENFALIPFVMILVYLLYSVVGTDLRPRPEICVEIERRLR